MAEKRKAEDTALAPVSPKKIRNDVAVLRKNYQVAASVSTTPQNINIHWFIFLI